MSKDNAGQVLFQVVEHFRSTSLSVDESKLLAFQLLTWAHLSAKGRLEASVTLDTALAQGGVEGLLSVLKKLFWQPGALGMAFFNASRYVEQANDAVFAALRTVKYLVDGGVFERFSPVDVAGDLVGGTFEGFDVPVELARLMKDIAVGETTRAAYLPWETSGQLVGVLMDQPDLRVHAEAHLGSQVAALLALFREAPTDVASNDPLRAPAAVHGGHLERFDATLSIPPMGMAGGVDDVVMQDIYSRFPVVKASVIGLMVQHIAAQTRGIAAIVVPNGFLFSSGKDRDVREYLLKQGWVEAVIALPNGIFQSSGLGTSMLVLNTQARHRRVGFVDASLPHFRASMGKGRVALQSTGLILDFCRRVRVESDIQAAAGRQEEDSYTQVVSLDAIFDNDATLDVGRYVIPDQQREAQARMETLPTETLDDVVRILIPIPNRDRGVDAEGVEVLEVGAADLPSAGYIRAPERSVSVRLAAKRSGDPMDIFLRPRDVLLVVKGTAGKVGIVPDSVPPPGEGGWIAGQSFVVLRSAQSDVDLRGLGLWLRSNMGQQVLEGIKTGATIPMMSISTLRKLKVLALNASLAEAAVEILERENELQWQIESLQDKQAGIAEGFWKELLAQLQRANKDQITP